MISYPCPPRDRWAALLRDELAADEQADLDAHLEGCPDCQRILEDCAANRDVWAGARKLREASPHDVALRTVMERLKTDPDAEPAVEVALIPDILDPSEQPGSLGRINSYEILQEIGRGGMGIVYKALDPALHRVVAIKVMAPELAVSGSARKRFEREARAAAAVCHEHVVTIHAVEEFKGLPYLVMHYIAGQSVQDKLAKGGPLPVPEILRIGTQVAEGLAAAHKQGIVHRDVKPANILLENGVERVKLTDFSLARAIDDASVTQSGVITGTPQYMSPEQARGEPVDARSDLFGLGSVLYALCTGRPPFRGNPIEVLRKVADETPKPIREQNPDIPAWLEAIVNKLMSKDPANRFATAAEVASLFGQCLAHVQHPAASPLPSIPGVPPTRRRRVHCAAAILPILAGLFVVSEATGYTQIVQAVATVLRFRTDEGTLVVEVDDPNIKVTLDDKDLVITGAGPQEVRLKPGSHRFLASRDGQVLKDELVEITRDGKRSVRVTLEGTGKGAAPWTPSAEEVRRAETMLRQADAMTLEANRHHAATAEAALADAKAKHAAGFITNSELRRIQQNRDRAVRIVAQTLETLGASGEPAEKRVRLEFRDKPWAEVLDWFGQTTRLPFVGSSKPTGKFNFIPAKHPDGQDREYTIREVIDILNESLLLQKFLLIRREASFTVLLADEKVDRTLLRTVTADVLPQLGKTELVLLMHHVRNANAQDLVPDIRRMMGPFGEVIGWNQMGTGGASFLLQDTAGNLTRIVEALKTMDTAVEKPQVRETHTVQCKYAKAVDVAQKLRDLFAHDRNRTGPMVTFEADERTNSVLISGWTNKVAEAKKVIETIDVPAPKRDESQKGPAEERFRMEFREKPWGEVLDWFADVSDLLLVPARKPTGKFSFVSPKKADGQVREYTIAEIIDILNEALMLQKLLLVRRDASFLIVPADEKIDRSHLRTVTADSLSKCGKTEVVLLMHDIRRGNVEEMVPNLRKMLGPFGEVVAFSRRSTGGGEVYLQDTAGNLSPIVKNMEAAAAQSRVRETLTVRCKYVKAGDLVQTLRKMFDLDRNRSGAIVTLEADEQTNSVLISGWTEQIADMKKVIDSIDVPAPKRDEPQNGKRQ